MYIYEILQHAFFISIFDRSFQLGDLDTKEKTPGFLFLLFLKSFMIINI